MKEYDPNGLQQHEPGAKMDAGKTPVSLVLYGFPKALNEVARVAEYGAAKYTPHGWKHVPLGVERYTDAMLRHLLAEGRGEHWDEESGLAHAAHAAWNAMARLELMLKEEPKQ